MCSKTFVREGFLNGEREIHFSDLENVNDTTGNVWLFVFKRISKKEV